MNWDKIANAKIWDNIPGKLKGWVLIVFAICTVLFLSKSEIADVWKSHDSAKYGVICMDAINDTANYYEAQLSAELKAGWRKINKLRHENDSLKSIVNK